MVTRKSKESDSGGLLILMIMGLLVFLPMLIVAAVHYYRLRSKYGITDDAQRIFETSSIFRPIAVGVGVGAALSVALMMGLSIIGNNQTWGSNGVVLTLALIVGAPLIWVAYHVARWVGATYFGVLVDRDNRKIFHPKDMLNYSITDYLKLKFIHELGEIESVPLDNIQRITRQSRVHLYLHGPFGSRGIKFPSKQKRDECLVAIEEAMGKRKTMMEIE